METYLLAGGLVIALLAAFTDVRSGRIPNRLAYGALLLGLAVRTFVGGWGGLFEGLLGALICGGIFLVFFVIGGMGAGDVKLMAAIGCWAGIRQGLVTVLATAIAGGILAVAYMVFYRRGSDTFRNMGSLMRFHLTSGLRTHPEINIKSSGAIKIPYAVAILIGTVYSMGLHLLR
ncbi:MAG: prepilin peptidase [Acidobacteria bacterium]|nr:MAG: prepilin peptidase [Acidobacteriota bacterium]